MNYYKVEKKRDGQQWKPFNEIYASSFEEAKKQFAKDMTQGNWSKSNNIQWVRDTEGVQKTGWYDFNGGSPVWNEETEKYENADDLLLVSEEQINEGFDFWNEDVYSWRLLDIEQKNYLIRNRETGTEIEQADSYSEAIGIIEKYEAEDKANGTYVDGFYEVYDTILEEVVQD